MKKLIFILLCLLPTLCYADFQLVNDAGEITFESHATTPIMKGTSLPSVCAVGDRFFDTDATAGRNIYGCTATNTWTIQGDGNDAGSPTWGTIIGTLSAQTDLNTALGLKATIDAPTFTGIPAAPTAAAGTNTTQLATTAFTTAINNNASYRTIYQGSGSHIAAKVAGNYVFPPGGGVMAVGGTGTLYPQQVFYLTIADYPTIDGKTPVLRIKGSVFCNDVAPFTGTFTFGLYPITRPGTSGGAGVCIYTVGTVVSGSNGAVVTNAAADSSNNAIGADFAFPADGWYALVVVTSATMATSAHTHIKCELQMRNN